MQQQQADIASVLVIAADPNIASLIGELVAFAGHRPEHDVTSGAAGEAIRRSRPNVSIIDASLPRPVVDSCVDACDEVRARPILTSSGASESELLDEARDRGCIPFALPGTPLKLGDTLDRIMRISARPPVEAVRRDQLVHPAFCAAIAGIERARSLTQQMQIAVGEMRLRRNEARESLDNLRRSRNALRAAVADYASHLRRRDVRQDRMLLLVGETLSECASIVDGQSVVDSLDGEWRAWAIEAFLAASLSERAS